MAAYETWFVATDAELDALFPGWTAAGEPSEPVVPLPIWTSDALPSAPVRAPSSGYFAALEDETPAGLRALPHFRWSDSPFDLIDGVAAQLGWLQDVPLLRRGPHNSSEQVGVVRGLPGDVCARLATLTEDEIRELGVEIENAFDPDDLEHIELLLALRDLAELAAARGAHVCVFVTI
jgi:hypothetical protein